MDSGIDSPTEPASPTGADTGEATAQIIESPSGGALWRAYLTSVLNKPIIREEEIHNEIQTVA